MPIHEITVRGARTHNLKNISLSIPRNSLTVITGISGSGKSSLAFDTLYAEGQRRYVESLSAYARQFLDQLERPDVDSIEGLSPSISIEQKTTSRSPRSTVGTITEIYDYLRLLFSSIGTPHCPRCHQPIARQSTEQIVRSIMELSRDNNGEAQRIMILASIVRGRKGEFKKTFDQLARQGWTRARVDGALRSLDEPIKLDRRRNHTIEIVIDRLLVKPGIEKRLETSLETSLKLAQGLVTVAVVDGDEHLYSDRLACHDCGLSVPQLEPRSFSFNSPYGACPDCHGLGSRYDLDPAKVITDWSKPLFEGGLGPGGGSTYFQRWVEHLAARHGFDARKPFEELPRRIQNLVLYGSRATGRESRSVGLLDLLRRSYEESKSEDYREWMEQFMSATPCAACGGRRLRPEWLAVKLPLAASSRRRLPSEARRAQEGASIDELCALPISDVQPVLK